jgi:hypothetical protein
MNMILLQPKKAWIDMVSRSTSLNTRMLNPMPILTHALCSKVKDGDIFFPSKEAGKATNKEAKKICYLCDDIEICREYAIDNHVDGIWGGTSPTDRQHIRKERREV